MAQHVTLHMRHEVNMRKEVNLNYGVVWISIAEIKQRPLEEELHRLTKN